MELTDWSKIRDVSIYINHFNTHYRLLLERYKRFCEIDYIYNTDIDVITYLDIIVVQIRSMCIENKNYKKNYTAQNLLRKLKRDDLADKLDIMLNAEFKKGVFTDFPTSTALKLLADKFICHYDAADDEQWAMARLIERQLRNPYDEVNLKSIMGTITECIGEGFGIIKA